MDVLNVVTKKSVDNMIQDDMLQKVMMLEEKERQDKINSAYSTYGLIPPKDAKIYVSQEDRAYAFKDPFADSLDDLTNDLGIEFPKEADQVPPINMLNVIPPYQVMDSEDIVWVGLMTGYVVRTNISGVTEISARCPYSLRSRLTELQSEYAKELHFLMIKYSGFIPQSGVAGLFGNGENNPVNALRVLSFIFSRESYINNSGEIRYFAPSIVNKVFNALCQSLCDVMPISHIIKEGMTGQLAARSQHKTDDRKRIKVCDGIEI